MDVIKIKKEELKGLLEEKPIINIKNREEVDIQRILHSLGYKWHSGDSLEYLYYDEPIYLYTVYRNKSVTRVSGILTYMDVCDNAPVYELIVNNQNHHNYLNQ